MLENEWRITFEVFNTHYESDLTNYLSLLAGPNLKRVLYVSFPTSANDGGQAKTIIVYGDTEKLKTFQIPFAPAE